MHFSSLYYFVEIAKEKNISRAAKHLHISQQALSQHIQKLEKYYGTILFNRKQSLTLTYTGELLFESAQKILLLNDNTIRQIAEAKDSSMGQLKIGATANLLSECLPETISRFKKRWPNVLLQLNMNSYDAVSMRQQLQDGTLDICLETKSVALTDIEHSNTDNESIITFKERMFLIVPKVLMQSKLGENYKTIIERNKKGVSIQDFSTVPFILLRQGKTKRRIADELFNKAGVSPIVVMEVTNSEQITPLLPLHLGAFFCDGVRVKSFMQNNQNDYLAFPLQISEYHMRRMLCVETDIRHYQEKFAVDFIAILKQVFAEMYGSNTVL